MPQLQLQYVFRFFHSFRKTFLLEVVEVDDHENDLISVIEDELWTYKKMNCEPIKNRDSEQCNLIGLISIYLVGILLVWYRFLISQIDHDQQPQKPSKKCLPEILKKPWDVLKNLANASPKLTDSSGVFAANFFGNFNFDKTVNFFDNKPYPESLLHSKHLKYTM